MPLTKDLYRTGVSKLFGSPRKLLHNSARVRLRHLT